MSSHRESDLDPDQEGPEPVVPTSRNGSATFCTKSHCVDLDEVPNTHVRTTTQACDDRTCLRSERWWWYSQQRQDDVTGAFVIGIVRESHVIGRKRRSI